jgi:cell division protein FtsQ
MLPIFGEDIGRNVFFVPLSERRKQLEELPWVEKATVMRLLPDQLSVSVVERKPVAFVRHGSQIGLVDADGVLLTMPAAMMAQHHYSFPVVTGINVNDTLTARRIRMKIYQRLLAELDASGQNVSEQISEIDLSDPHDARVLMPEQGSDILAHFGQEQFLDRYLRYQAHIREWRQKYPKLASVDLRYDQQVVLQMTAGSNVAQAAADEQNAASAAAAKPESDEAATSGPVAVKTPVKQPNATKIASSQIHQVAKPAPAKQVAKPVSAPPATANVAASGKTAVNLKTVNANKPETNSKPGASTKTAMSAKPTTTVKTATISKPASKPSAKSTASAKTAASKTTAAKTAAAKKTAKAKQAKIQAANKKNAEAKLAAQNAARPKPSPINRPAANTAAGQ